MMMRARRHGALVGRVRVPGDKSISHRSLMLGALAVGRSSIDGLLEGEDVLATAEALRAMGVGVSQRAPGDWQVQGVGVSGLAAPDQVLDMGNAGTGARLMLGILAGHPFTSFMTGDASLRSRPMRRVIEPLRDMGAEFLARPGDRLPLAVTGRNDLMPIEWRSPVASAQVKSAVLLAGLHAPGTTSVDEPAASRDHTERMLAGMGADLRSEVLADGRRRIEIDGQCELRAQHFTVPGDPSSAAFLIAAAAMSEGSALAIENVGLNPLRTGFIETLREMGADLEVSEVREVAGEPIGDLLVRGAALRAVDVAERRAPTMIDEYPILAIVAAFARGTTRMRGLAELRVKESDRLSAVAEGLSACGVEVSIEGDDLAVTGAPRQAGGARIDARLDHRIAMSFLVFGGHADDAVEVVGTDTIATSFPDFADVMSGIGARLEHPNGQP